MSRGVNPVTMRVLRENLIKEDLWEGPEGKSDQGGFEGRVLRENLIREDLIKGPEGTYDQGGIEGGS